MVALTFVSAVGLLLYLLFADLSTYKTNIEESVLDGTGFELSIGEFDLDIGGQVVLTAAQVVVTNPEYPDAPQMATIGHLHTVIDTWSFLTNEVDVEVFELEDMQVALHQQEDGRANWQATPRQPQIPIREEEMGQAELILHALNLDNIGVSYEVPGQAPLALSLESLVLDRQLDGSTQYEFAGRVSAEPVDTPVTGDGVFHAEGNRSLIAGGRLAIEGGDFGIDGWFDPSGEALQAEFSLTAEGQSLAALGDSFAASGLPVLPYELAVDVSAIPSGVELHDLTLALGEGQLRGSASLKFGGERPVIHANINSPTLDLRRPPGEGEEEETSAEELAGDATREEPGLVFSDQSLEYSFLDAADVEAEVFVDSVLLDSDELTEFSAKISLSDRDLSVDPFGFRSGDGELSGTIGLRPADGSYALDVNVAASNLRLGVLGSAEQDPATIPPLDAQLVLSGRGASLHEIMAGANGSLKGSQQGGQIDLQAAGVLFSDLVTSIFRAINPLAETETLTALECGIYDVNIVDGIATIEQLAVQSDKLTIISSGDINLDTEVIDMTLSTKTREGFGVSLGGVVNSFLKLGGTLGAPSVGVDAAGSVTTTGVAVMTGGMSVLAKGLFDRVSAEADLCAALQDPEAEAAPVE
jgi:uncharacterized protein involved in outer membrane biogenesis